MKKYLVAMLAALLTACGGGGGGGSTATSAAATPSTPASSSTPASTPSVPATPIKVQASSYENKIAAANAIGPQVLPSEVGLGNAVAFADFFQDGSYSMVTASCNDVSCGGSGGNGTLHFYKSVNGQWVDHTSDILSDATGCIHPRKAIVADFNGDGKPDVLFACHGVDAQPYPGEKPQILLSQPSGQYKNVTLDFTGFFHSASAADFSGKGFADIVVVDPQVAQKPYFLVNQGDGTFKADMTRIPDETGKTGMSIFTTELIDFSGSGKYDLFLAGTAPTWVPTIFKNDGTNVFKASNSATIPYDPQHSTTLDVVTAGGAIYTTSVQQTGGNYGNSTIDKNIQPSQNEDPLYNGTTNFSNGMSWINWIIPYNGKIVSLNSTYGVSVSQ